MVNGINWSPWEPLNGGYIKFITLPAEEGEHSIITRYKNQFGDITLVKDENDIMKYVLDITEPEIQVQTLNGTLITKSDGIALKIVGRDNFSSDLTLRLFGNFVVKEGDITLTGNIPLKSEQPKELFVNGLKSGFNVLSFTLTDKAGNIETKEVRIFKKG